MKKVFCTPAYLAVFLIVIYCLGLILGIIAICSYPFLKQKHYFLSETLAIAQEYCEGADNTVKLMSNQYTHILFFDAEGTCIRHVYPTVPGYALNISFQKGLSSALAGKNVFYPKFALDEAEIVTCVPIRDDDTIIGAVVLARAVTSTSANWYETLKIFFICFTILYWSIAFFLAWANHKNKKYEKLRQNYIANVTHALKAPITSVKALTEALSDVVEPDSDKQRIYYGMILQETNVQKHMVQEILTLSKLQSYDMDFHKASVSAAECFQDILDKYAMLCGCSGISFHVAEEISQLPRLYTNAACIKQVLEILLENAVKYADDGDDIWVDVTTAKNQATFCVRDNGIGISKEDLAHIFERFYRCSRQKKKSGSGLGLAIAKETLDGLKEKIWVESESGKGAAFFFTVHLK